jgi:phage antirepressor YoqD-like protein
MNFERIPEKGNIVSQVKRLEETIGDPKVESYEEVSACSLTCKICQSASCDESSAIK